MENKITSYKGFNPDMTCRSFQYKEGGEYETQKARACECGFHACEYPLDVFNYYPPAGSKYHVVKQGGELSRHDGDSKVASTKIKVGVEIGIPGLVKAAIEYTTSRAKSENSERATGYQGAASATGYQGAASATGNRGAASATGYQGAASATGDQGAASATGNRGAASATGDQGAASATGDQGAASATGYQGAASATGYQGAASADNETAIAVAWGLRGKAKGVIGAHIVCAEWEWDDDKGTYRVISAQIAVVDGEKIKADTYYRLSGGEFVEAVDV